MLRKNPFIKPMAPTLVKAPPGGEVWIHEVKFDGWRAQVHVEEGEATLFSKNGVDLTRRFRDLKPVIDFIPAKSAIIDCELVACDEAGLPCFRTLMDYGKNNAPLCLWAFDLLYLNGVRITPLALTERKKKPWPMLSWRPTASTCSSQAPLPTSAWRVANKDRFELFQKKRA